MARYERVVVPAMHPKQAEIYNSVMNGQQFTVVAAGRRFGKSMLALSLAIDMAVNQGKRVWWVSPTYKQAGKQWRTAKRMLMQDYTSKLEQEKRMHFDYINPNTGEEMHGEMMFLSGQNPDTLRGDSLDFVIIDEAAFCDPEVWRVLRPALTDRAGGAIFISTPRGLNWFYNLFRVGETKESKRWKSWQFTSYDNPFIPKEEIDDARLGMTEYEFLTEHLARFEESDSRVFRNVYDAACLKPLDRPIRDREYVFGIDIARRADYTVITVIDRESGDQVAMSRWAGAPFPVQKKRIMALYYRWRPIQSYIEENAAGAAVIEELQEMGMKNIVPVFTGRYTKHPMIDALALAFEKGAIRILSQDTSEGNAQYTELTSYEVTQSASGNWQYSAPRGAHDDTVMALALAWKGMTGRRSVLRSSENVFYPEAQLADKKKPKRTLIDRYRKKREFDASSDEIYVTEGHEKKNKRGLYQH